MHQRALTTIIMVTHSREVAARSDRVFYLDAGKILEVAR
jgi:predicted ABC-type transport system involved in lysophospholipase L1 biosynthesis ATPase subunit